MRQAENKRKVRNQKSITPLPPPLHASKNRQQKLTGAQKLDFKDKDLRAAIINTLKELKEAMLTE